MYSHVLDCLDKLRDNGPQFSSEEFRMFLSCNGIKHTLVSPYLPASNGAAERLVETFKYNLAKCANDSLSIDQKIADFLLRYTSIQRALTNCRPGGLFLGRELATRLALVKPDLLVSVNKQQANQRGLISRCK